MFNTINEAIDYLKKLEGVIIPIDFTYFNHCTSYILPRDEQKNTKKIWQEIPKDGFVIYREMSFTERDTRIISALEQGGVDKAPITYGIPSLPHLPFIIRVIMPKKENNLNLSEQSQKELNLIYSGYGDNRHPKLPNGTSIHMFASSTIDEVSGKKVDILYGVRSQDIIKYANKVYEEMQKEEVYPTPIMPEIEEIEVLQNLGFTKVITKRYAFTTDFEFNKHTYSLPKSKDFGRYQKQDIIDANGIVQATMDSQFESELRNQTRKSR